MFITSKTLFFFFPRELSVKVKIRERNFMILPKTLISLIATASWFFTFLLPMAWTQDQPQEIPKDFGAVNGTPITNKNGILEDVDKALQVEKPPAVEYILVMPVTHVNFPYTGRGSGANPFGHSAVRYTLPDGTQKVFNISGVNKNHMVEFHDPKEYFFGTQKTSQQQGVYNREMVSIRFEDVPPEKILEMDSYFQELKVRHEVQKCVAFHVSPLTSRLHNFLFPGNEWGNCGYWSSQGLVKAGLLDKSYGLPSAIWLELYKNSLKKPVNQNTHIVSYQRPAHAQLTYGNTGKPFSLMSAYNMAGNWLFRNPHHRAEVVVQVPHESITAVAVLRKSEEVKPSTFTEKMVLEHPYLATACSLVVAGAILKRGGLATLKPWIQQFLGKIRPFKRPPQVRFHSPK